MAFVNPFLRKMIFFVLILFSGACSHLVLNKSKLPDGKIGQEYNVDLQVLNGSTPVGGVTVSQRSLPKGLRIAHEKFEDHFQIIGIPEEKGKFRFTLSFWCYGTNFAGKQGQQDLEIRVSE